MLLTVLFIIGITAEAMTAALAAGRQKMDLFGVIMLAEVTALGGGTVRDVVLGHHPLTWVKTPEYLLIVAGAALITVFVSRLMVYFRTVFLTADAVGLAVFTVVGINVAQGMGYGFILALVAATITGVFGGVLRDIFSNRIPLVFRKELYAMVVLIGVVGFWILQALGVQRDINIIVTLLVVFIVRMLAVKFKWSLPVFDYQEREYPSSERTQIWKTAWNDLPGVRHLRRRRNRRKENNSKARNNRHGSKFQAPKKRPKNKRRESGNNHKEPGTP